MCEVRGGCGTYFQLGYGTDPVAVALCSTSELKFQETFIDRRNFLAAGSLASTRSMVASVGVAQASTKSANEMLFKGVDFTTYGLGLKPAEYAVLLSRAVDAGAVKADGYSRGGLVEQMEQVQEWVTRSNSCRVEAKVGVISIESPGAPARPCDGSVRRDAAHQQLFSWAGNPSAS
jgi:hypothetical protein